MTQPLDLREDCRMTPQPFLRQGKSAVPVVCSCPVNHEGEIVFGEPTCGLHGVGCCGASCKADCQRPPCPCNLEAWTEHERENIQINQRKKA